MLPGLCDSKLAVEVVEKEVKDPEKRNNYHEGNQGPNGPLHRAMNLMSPNTVMSPLSIGVFIHRVNGSAVT